MPPIRSCLFVVLSALAIAANLAGCALVDQNVPLKYDALGNDAAASFPSSTAHAAAASREVVDVLTPRESHELSRNTKGLYVVGHVKNGFGMKTADVTTKDSIPGWISGALVTELNARGYTAGAAENPGGHAAVETEILQFGTETNPTLLTMDESTTLRLRCRVLRAGRVLREFDIHGSGAKSGLVGGGVEKTESLKRCLQDAMRQAVPQVVEALGG